MDTLSYRTASLGSHQIETNWLVIDANNQVLGRLTSQIAHLLRGKHKTSYTPNTFSGDHVVVINAEKVAFTGKKWDKKVYVSHTGYPGGQRHVLAKHMLAKFPIRIVEHAVRGMLPKTRLGSEMYRHLHVYTGSSHPHQAQQPKEYSI